MSFDVVELYPSIIIKHALLTLKTKMESDHAWHNKTDLSRLEVFNLVEGLTGEPYFECEKCFFRQTKGTPIRGALAGCWRT